MEGSFVGLRRLRMLSGSRGGGDRWDAPVLRFHEVENIAAARDEEQLHECVVYRHEIVEEVQITRQENRDVEGLRFETQTY